MKKFDFQFHIIDRRSFLTLLSAGLFITLNGCSTFKGAKKNKDKGRDPEFEEDEELGGNTEEQDRSVFDSERDKQTKLSEYVAENGRSSKDKKKKKISAGDTFLMSDKAKEIYANTER